MAVLLWVNLVVRSDRKGEQHRSWPRCSRIPHCTPPPRPPLHWDGPRCHRCRWCAVHGPHEVQARNGETSALRQTFQLALRYLQCYLPCREHRFSSDGEPHRCHLSGCLTPCAVSQSSDDVNATFGDISDPGNAKYHIPSISSKNFYGWVYTAQGVAVAHGNSGVGRVLSSFLLQTRFAAANKGGGFVDYSTGSETHSSGKTCFTHHPKGISHTDTILVSF